MRRGRPGLLRQNIVTSPYIRLGGMGEWGERGLQVEFRSKTFSIKPLFLQIQTVLQYCKRIPVKMVKNQMAKHSQKNNILTPSQFIFLTLTWANRSWFKPLKHHMCTDVSIAVISIELAVLPSITKCCQCCQYSQVLPSITKYYRALPWANQSYSKPL